eukprot:332786-Chlamydomonas_euryale.AAC.1
MQLPTLPVALTPLSTRPDQSAAPAASTFAGLGNIHCTICSCPPSPSHLIPPASPRPPSRPAHHPQPTYWMFLPSGPNLRRSCTAQRHLSPPPALPIVAHTTRTHRIG